MGLDASTLTEEQKRRFSRYLVFYGEGESCHGIKGISTDAPEDIKKEFLAWYRNMYRYPNGRLRPLNSKVFSEVLIAVK